MSANSITEAGHLSPRTVLKEFYKEDLSDVQEMWIVFAMKAYHERMNEKIHILKNGAAHDGEECNYTMCYSDNHKVKNKCLGWCETKARWR